MYFWHFAIATLKRGVDRHEPASDYTTTIDWGDGTISTGTVTQTGTGQYTVSGSHTYAEEGAYTAKVDISDADGDSAAPRPRLPSLTPRSPHRALGPRRSR